MTRVPGRPGFACWHNRKYWSNADYLGIGVGAHSHRRGLRWNNLAPVGDYIERLARGRMPVLRQAEGVSEQMLADRYGIAPREAFGAEFERLAEEGLLMAAEGRLHIPREKWLVSNEVLGNFIAQPGAPGGAGGDGHGTR